MVKGFGIDRAAVQAQVLGVPPGQVQLAGMVIGVVLCIVLGPRMGLAYQLPVLPVHGHGPQEPEGEVKAPGVRVVGPVVAGQVVGGDCGLEAQVQIPVKVHVLQDEAAVRGPAVGVGAGLRCIPGRMDEGRGLQDGELLGPAAGGGPQDPADPPAAAGGGAAAVELDAPGHPLAQLRPVRVEQRVPGPLYAPDLPDGGLAALHPLLMRQQPDGLVLADGLQQEACPVFKSVQGAHPALGGEAELPGQVLQGRILGIGGPGVVTVQIGGDELLRPVGPALRVGELHSVGIAHHVLLPGVPGGLHGPGAGLPLVPHAPAVAAGRLAQNAPALPDHRLTAGKLQPVAQPPGAVGCAVHGPGPLGGEVVQGLARDLRPLLLGKTRRVSLHDAPGPALLLRELRAGSVRWRAGIRRRAGLRRILPQAEGAGGGQGGRQRQGQGRRAPPAAPDAQNIPEPLPHDPRPAVEVGGQGGAAEEALLPPETGQEGLAVGPAVCGLRTGHHQIVACQLQIRLRLPDQQVDQGVEPVEARRTQQDQLIPQVPPLIMGELVAEDEPQLPLPPVLPGQKEPGPEETRQQRGPGGGGYPQNGRPLDPQLPAQAGADPDRVLGGAPAPPPGPAEKQGRAQKPPQPPGRPAGQPHPGQDAIQVHPPDRLRRDRWRGPAPAEDKALLPADGQLGHLDNHRGLRRRQDCRGPGGQLFPLDRGQQEQGCHDQPYPVPPPGAVAPVQGRLQRRQDQGRRPHHRAPFYGIQQQFHVYFPSNSSKYRRRSSRSFSPIARPS